MRKLLLLLVALPTLGWSQGQTFTNGANGGVNYVLVAPAGACLQGSPMRVVLGAGTIYTCQTLTWTLNAAAGGDAGVGVCTNQVVTATVSNAAPTCTTLTSAYVNNTIALTGTDVNTSNQVTVTHLAAALPIAQGGTAAATAANALISLFPTASEVGDLVYCATYSSGCTAWSTLVPATSGWLTTAGASTATSVTNSTTANKMVLWGVYFNGAPMLTTKVSYSISVTADNTANVYDLGLYDSGGNLKVHTGSIAGTVFSPATGTQTQNWTATATLMPGKYYIALTSNCTVTCAAILAQTLQMTFYNKLSDQAVTAGGTLDATRTMPGDQLSFANTIPSLMIR